MGFSARLGRQGLPALLIVYAGLSLAYNFTFPPQEPSDEPAHYRYVRWLLDERSLPVARPDEGSEFHQPPLYYALAALFAWPVRVAPDVLPQIYDSRSNPHRGYHYWEPGLDNKNLWLHGPWDLWPFPAAALSVHLARLASLVCGLVTVYATYKSARLFFDEAPALAATALVAFNPMFLAVSGSLQNDAGAAAMGALTIWICLVGLRRGFNVRLAMLLGIVLGLGALMKITAIFLLPAGVFAVAAWAWRARVPVRQANQYVAIVLGAAAVSGGWWYVRNVVLYGEPTAVNVNLQAYGGRTIAEGIAVWNQALPYAWTTFWGRFGHGDVVLPSWIYIGLAVFCLVAVVGLVRAWRRPHWIPRAEFAFLALAGALEFTGLMGYLTLSPSGYMGRYVFPALPAYGILLVLGWLSLVPARAGRMVSGGIVAGFAALGTFTWAAYLAPVYSPPPALAGLPASATRLDAALGNVAILRGYEINPKTVRPGERVAVTVYWETVAPTDLPYSVYIHLIDQEQTLAAQRDTYPGLGRYPTTAWRPGHLFVDTYNVELPATTYAPTQLQASVGLWQADTGDRAYVLDATGQPAAADVSLGQIDLVSRPDSLPNAARLNFGGLWVMEGYELSARTLRPGATFELTTFWMASKGTPAHLFVHVTGDDGRMWVNASQPIQPGRQVIELTLAPDTPAGLYNFVVGVFESGGTQSRLMLLGDDGHEIDSQIRLSGVRVIP